LSDSETKEDETPPGCACQNEKSGKNEKNLAVLASPKPRNGKIPLPPELKSACVETWNGYSDGYIRRYGIEPVKNAKTAGQIVALVKRIGKTDAPNVAGWFPGHQSAYYVGRGHSVDCLLKDAEKLRTEWATGRSVTATEAMQADRTQTNLSAVDAAIEILARRQA
jgi:hypothetical protein